MVPCGAGALPVPAGGSGVPILVFLLLTPARARIPLPQGLSGVSLCFDIRKPSASTGCGSLDELCKGPVCK